jgi:hypothetical protein
MARSTNAPESVSRLPDGSNIESDSKSLAPSDQWTLTEKQPLILPGISGDEESEWDVKSAVVEEYTRCVLEFALTQRQD